MKTLFIWCKAKISWSCGCHSIPDTCEQHDSEWPGRGRRGGPKGPGLRSPTQSPQGILGQIPRNKPRMRSEGLRLLLEKKEKLDYVRMQGVNILWNKESNNIMQLPSHWWLWFRKTRSTVWFPTRSIQAITSHQAGERAGSDCGGGISILTFQIGSKLHARAPSSSRHP